jgi:hypothetical protein
MQVRFSPYPTILSFCQLFGCEAREREKEKEKERERERERERDRERVQLILGHAQERGATVNYYVNNSQAAAQSTCILSKPVIFSY